MYELIVYRTDIVEQVYKFSLYMYDQDSYTDAARTVQASSGNIVENCGVASVLPR